MHSSRLFLVIACLFAVVLQCRGIESEEVKLDQPVSRILLSEDNSYLAAAHYNSGVVSVINPKTLKVDATLRVPSPGAMLSRGTNLYISDCESGVIKIFSTKDWRLINEVAAGGEAVVYISAPQGSYFRDKLLITSLRKADGVFTVRLVDVANDTQVVVGDARGRYGVYSYNGKYVLELTDRDGQQRIVAFDAATYLPGKKIDLGKVEGNNVELFQNADDDLWFSGNDIKIGLPPKSLMGRDLSGQVIPDNTQGSLNCYVLNEQGSVLAVHQLDDEFSRLEEVTITKERGPLARPHYRGALSNEANARSYAFSSGGNSTVFFIDDRDKLQALRVSGGVTNSEPYVKQLDKADSYTIIKAPPGAAVDGSGLLRWVPAVGTPAGDYVFKVRLDRAEGAAFFHDQVSVKQGAARRGAVSPAKFTEDIFLEADFISGRMVLQSGTKIMQYDASGSKILSSGTLDRNYKKVILGDGYLAALDENAVIIFDPVSYKVIRRIEVGAYQARSMVLDRTRNQLLVGGFDPAEKNPVEMYPIYRVDPNKGTRTLLKRTIGETLFINNRLGVLVSVVDESRTHMLPGMRYIEAKIDFMAVYRIEADGLKVESTIQDYVAGVRSVQFTANGQNLIAQATSTAFGGERIYNVWPIFGMNDLNKPLDFIRRNPASKLGQNLAIVTHPYLDVIAVITAPDATDRDNKTLLLLRDLAGNDLTEKYGVPAVLNRKVTALCFAPDGKTLVYVARDFYGRPIVGRVPLVIPADALKGSASGRVPAGVKAVDSFKTPVSVQAVSADSAPSAEKRGKGLAQWQAVKLMETRNRPMGSESISMMNMPTVVVIRNDDGSSGAGFFVSGNGYILTAAHVISPLGKPTVSCYFDFIFNYRAVFEVKAEVVAVDEGRDLALLKVDTGVSMNFVRLNKISPKQGEEVYAIGHPGLAEVSLNYTITSGLVSNPAQEVNGRTYLQISAPVNPGNSGGPVFDNAGNVIGLVSQKSTLDGVAFAVPAGDIAAFLSSGLDRTQTKDMSEAGYDAAISQLRARGMTVISDLIFTGGVASLRGARELFTGKVAVLNTGAKIWMTIDIKAGKTNGYIIEYYPDQKMKYQAGVLGGQRHGPQKGWYPSGNLKLESELKQGVLDGVERAYYDDTDRVQIMRTFRGGRLDGLGYEMDTKGRVTKRYVFKDGNLIQENALYYPDATPGDPYLESIKAGDVEMIHRHSLKRKVANIKSDPTPLQLAIDTDLPEVVAEVIRNGADVNAVDAQGESPLQRAKARKVPNEQIIRMLSLRGSVSTR